MSTENKQNLNMNFDLDLSSFITVIKTNFQQLWEYTQKNNQSIQECKERLLMLNRGVTPQKAGMKRNTSKDLSLDYSENSEAEPKDKQNEEKIMTESKFLNHEEINDQVQQNKEKGGISPPPTLPKKQKNNDSDIYQERKEQMPTFNQKQKNKETTNQIYQKKEEDNTQSKVNIDEGSFPYEESSNPNQSKNQKVIENEKRIVQQDESIPYQESNKNQSKKYRASQLFDKEKGIEEESLPYNESISRVKDTEAKLKSDKNELQSRIQEKVEYQNQQLMENKIFELNERISNLEMLLTKQNSVTAKKFNMLQNEIENKNQAFAKNVNQLKMTEKQIELLRNQLSQYKLRKQAQFMRLSGKNQNGHNPEFGNYIVEKIQFLSKYTAQMATKEQFNDEVQSLGKKLERINKKLNESIGQQQFYGIIKALEKKIKKRSGNVPVENEQNETIQDDIIGNEIKINEQGKKLKELQQKLEIGLSQLMNHHKKDQTKISQLLSSLEQAKIKVQKNGITIKDHEEFMRNMNANYNDKFGQVSSQIIQTQESIDKINNQLKFYNYTSNSKSETSPTLGNAPSTQALDINKSVQLQNEITFLKKKMNKMTMKVQTVKEEVLAARQDFSRQQDGIKMSVEKKCDWESLRKGLGFFEDKMRQFSNVINGLIQNMEADKNEQTTAAKRGWTCLCCDKDIKNFQGKLSEAKFMSIFPGRYESPRIGGYFKQKAADKDYKNVYMKHNRKLSQNPVNKSRDQIL